MNRWLLGMGAGSLYPVRAALLSLALVGASVGHAATFRYFRFTPTDLRNWGAANSVQLAEIRYTTDGTIPTTQSPRYIGSISFTASTQVRARAFQAGSAPGPGPVRSAGYAKLAPDASAFSSNLPVFVLDNYGHGGVPTREPLQENYFLAFEANATGRTWLTDAPRTAHRAGIKRRGSSTLNDPKGNYRLEFWDESNADENVSLLGLPKDPDWILFAPYRFDRSMLRIPFIHQLSLNI